MTELVTWGFIGQLYNWWRSLKEEDMIAAIDDQHTIDALIKLLANEFYGKILEKNKHLLYLFLRYGINV